MKILDDPKIQGVIIGAIGALLNRAGVMFGNQLGWTSFAITMGIEIVIPFVCTFVLCLLLKQKILACFQTSVFASLVGALTTLLTINWD